MHLPSKDQSFLAHIFVNIYSIVFNLIDKFLHRMKQKFNIVNHDKNFMVQVSVIMGSKSDYESMKEAIDILKEFGVSYEAKIVSAHRTPDYAFQYAKDAEKNGIKVIIAAAGGAAHLAGVVAALTPLPVIGVPMPSKHLNGIDSLLSIVQMPPGIPVGTVSIGGAKNAALLALRILSLSDNKIMESMKAFMDRQTKKVLEEKL